MFLSMTVKYLLVPGFVVAVYSAPALANDFASLKGLWNCEEDGTQYTLEFSTANQLVYGGQRLQYQLQENTLLVQEDYGYTPYLLQMQEADLIILSPDGSVSRCRKGEVAQAVVPLKKQPATATSSDIQALVPGSNWPVYARPAGNVSWDSSDPQALLYKFAGRWDNYSGSTLTNIYLKPDGSYEDSSETSYSGSFSDQGGYQTGAWGATGQNRGGGYWTIKGTLSRGVIKLVANDGRHNVINYQVHVKNGEYYGGEYFFNGALHSVNYIYR